MTRQRALRVAEQLKSILSEILREDVKDPRIGFTSIVDVEVSGDLRHAKIYISVYGSDEERTETLQTIRNASGFIRTELGQRVRLRHIPELTFLLDKSMERGQRIEQLLKELNDGDGSNEEKQDGQ
jgi:ribosome-binding factor A